jgi:hypothetical protein
MPLSAVGEREAGDAIGLAAAAALPSVTATYRTAPCGVMLDDLARDPQTFTRPGNATVTLSPAQWHMVGEALDECEYAVEHSPGGGIRPSTRERYRQRRQDLLDAMPSLQSAIYEQTELPPL